MDRFSQFKTILNDGNYFKLVCGAGNQDDVWVEKLVFVYTLAGATGIDIAAVPDVVKAAKSGINKAYDYIDNLNRSGKDASIKVRPFLTVSVGMPGDHHVRKAWINDKCTACDKCIPVCPTEAIPNNLVIIDSLCIGCGACEAVCHFDSIDYTNAGRDLEKLLPELISLGADNVELHAAVPDNDTVMEEWRVVCDCVPENYCSMSIDRNYLSNMALLERIEMAKEIAGERLLIQADGVPMGGVNNEISTTVQAVAIAQQINKMIHLNKKVAKKDRDLKMILSGGTNSMTRQYAMDADVVFHGIAIGTYARKAVWDELENPDFFNDKQLIESAITKASTLVSQSVNDNNNVELA